MKPFVFIVVLLGIVLQGCTTSSQKPAVAKAECCTADEVKYTSFGEPAANSNAPHVDVAKVIAAPGEYDGKVVRVSGTVQKVCAKKGCWLTLGESEQPVFVKFTCPISGRLIPMDAVGKPAIVEGTVKVVEMSQEEARHYKEDAGAPKEEVEKIVGPQKRITVASPSAKIAGL